MLKKICSLFFLSQKNVSNIEINTYFFYICNIKKQK